MSDPNIQLEGAAGSISNGGGSFPLTSIAILESSTGYTRWSKDISDWLVLNNLHPFSPTTNPKACVAIRQRLGYNGRQLIKKDGGDPQAMLNTVAKKLQA